MKLHLLKSLLVAQTRVCVNVCRYNFKIYELASLSQRDQILEASALHQLDCEVTENQKGPSQVNAMFSKVCFNPTVTQFFWIGNKEA